MRHCLPDPEAAKSLSYHFTVYSCEFNNGTRARGNEIRLGEDGMILLFLCDSCHEQLKGQVLSPLIIAALKANKGMPILGTTLNIEHYWEPAKHPDDWRRPSSLSDEIEGEG